MRAVSLTQNNLLYNLKSNKKCFSQAKSDIKNKIEIYLIDEQNPMLVNLLLRY